MSIFTQKWIAILALALMPAGVYANVCATWGDLAKIGATLKAVATADVAVCDAGICPYASLCDLAQAVLIGNVPRTFNAQQCSNQVAEAPQISIAAEPHPPLQPL